ncbi:MAG: hydantoinase/oxoprolinase family protein [Rhizobiales bacterium]|nr:hydantoinase/oxoprolinase family protein [Hyphomicrobiales bacterium]
MSLLLGIDTGGTFTDAVLLSESEGIIATAKSLTTRDDLARGIAGAVDAALADVRTAGKSSEIGLVSLSTTLATNALVEGQGGRIGLVMIGFEETALERAGLRAALAGDPVLFIAGGHDAHGNRLHTLDLAYLERSLETFAEGITAFAVAGAFGVRNPEDEIAVRDRLRTATGRPVTCSHELSSRLDGPRRAMTSVLNARLIGLIHHLITASEQMLAARGISAPLMIVRGDGALVAAAVAKEKPIETILSGPAASLVGAAYLTRSPNAIVSDIGGTTTDVAILRDGRPALDRDGATVGGWRTMVEAVAMRTIGLGGDSEVRVELDGLGWRLELGPRRRIPISLLAAEHPAIVHPVLDRQLKLDRLSDFHGAFVRRVRFDAQALAGLEPAHRLLLERMGPQPVALESLITHRIQTTHLARLVSLGHVQLSQVTPSDAAHVLALHDAWDGQAAEKAMNLFARRRAAGGQAIASGAGELARAIIDRLEELSADLLLDTAAAEDGISGHPISGDAVVRAALAGHTGLVRPRVSLTVPVIGLGASAATYYPAIARRLGTEVEVPEHAGVANAVGAVVGQVSVTVRIVLSQPTEGRYRAHATSGAVDFDSVDAAFLEARSIAEREARERARLAGAAEVEVRHYEDRRVSMIEGREMFISGEVRAQASGRPRIVQTD